jgi:hypothetical protein
MEQCIRIQQSSITFSSDLNHLQLCIGNIKVKELTTQIGYFQQLGISLIQF